MNAKSTTRVTAALARRRAPRAAARGAAGLRGRSRAATTSSATATPAAAASSCRRSALASGTTSATMCPSPTSGPSSGVPSTWASPSSTWPTTTGRPTARRRRTSAVSSPRTCAPTGMSWSSPPRPAGTCGRPLRLPWLAQVPARLARPDRWRAWASTTSTSSTRIASTRTRRSRRRWAPSHAAVQQGKARYVGISSYAAERTREAIRILAGLGTPLLIHQPNYSMFNRWIEEGLLDVLGEAGVGCIPFSPLAQGLLTDRYLKGIPAGSRGSQDKSMSMPMFSKENLERVKALNRIARRRGQSLAQMAILWVLRDQRVTSALIGASSIAQFEDSLGALDGAPFDDEELAEIDATPRPSAAWTCGLTRPAVSRRPRPGRPASPVLRCSCRGCAPRWRDCESSRGRQAGCH